MSNNQPTEQPRQVTSDNYFAMIPLWVLDAVSGNSVKLYCVLRSYADRDSETCFPSRTTLMRRCQVTQPTLSKMMNELVDAGALTVERRGLLSGGYTSNFYTIISASPLVKNVAEVLKKDGVGTKEITPTPTKETSPLIISNITRFNELEINHEIEIPCNRFSADVVYLCELLAGMIVGNGSKRPTISKAWLLDMDKLIRLDERTPQQVEACIRWSQGHSFWRGNILSPAKLRMKYDQMRLQASAPATMSVAERAMAQGKKDLADLIAEQEARDEQEAYASIGELEQ